MFDGPNTRAANGGNALKLFGSSPTHSSNATDVMFPSPAVGYARDDWSPLDAAVLMDLGYEIVSVPIPEPSTLVLGVLGLGGLIRRARSW